MKTTISGLIGLMVIIISLFVIPESTFNTFDNYCLSIIVRGVIAMIMLLVILYPAFAGETKRFFFFVSVLLSTGVTATVLSMVAEKYFGLANYWIGCITITSIAFIYVLIKNYKPAVK